MNSNKTAVELSLVSTISTAISPISTLVVAIVSTKGGSSKTTQTANLGGYLADCGLKVLAIDFDIKQPSLSSYYRIEKMAPCGIFEMLVTNETSSDKIISKTHIPNLDII